MNQENPGEVKRLIKNQTEAAAYYSLRVETLEAVIAVIAEQASYALRYRHGEDAPTLRRTMAIILHHAK